MEVDALVCTKRIVTNLPSHSGLYKCIYILYIHKDQCTQAIYNILLDTISVLYILYKHMQFVLYTLYKFIGCMGDCHTAFEFGKYCTHYTCWPAIYP